jgi:glycosyltransferase involved in cell wall biosynthesis
MVTFIIPVKSEKVSGSWSQFSKLFERTLKSVTNQTSQNFRVIVVCHEKPETTFTHPGVKYIYVDFPVPALKTAPKEKHDGLKEEDKSKKILAGVAYAEKYDTDFYMVVDADDCISNRIVAHIENNKSSNQVGWYINKGYFYREGDKIISLNRNNFNTLCGTCIIVRPKYIKDIFQEVPHLLYVHQTETFNDGAELAQLPFPGAVYSMANGENHYMSGNQMRQLNSRRLFSLETLKGIFRKLKRYRIKKLNNKIMDEFGIYRLS